MLDRSVSLKSFMDSRFVTISAIRKLIQLGQIVVRQLSKFHQKYPVSGTYSVTYSYPASTNTIWVSIREKIIVTVSLVVI